MQKRAVVGGAGGFIGHHMVRYLKDKGYWVRGVDIKEPEYEPSSADEFLVLDLREWENCLRATDWRRGGLPARRRHGRHRLHHGQPGRDRPQQRADQRAHARGRLPQRRAAPLLLVERVHLPPLQAARPRRDAAEGGGRLSGRARGGLRVGEALLGEALPVLPRGGQARDPRGPLPQHLRSPRHVRGRPREGAGRDQPEGRPRQRRRRHRDLGRRSADPVVHLRRRLRGRHLPHRAERPLGAAEPRLRPARDDRPARRSRERGGRQDAREAARPDEATGRARPQQRQRPLQGGARLGAGGHARGRPEVHLRVDRRAARGRWATPDAGRAAPDRKAAPPKAEGPPDGGPSCIRSRVGSVPATGRLRRRRRCPGSRRWGTRRCARSRRSRSCGSRGPAPGTHPRRCPGPRGRPRRRDR